MIVYFSVPDRDVVDMDLPAVPAVGDSVAMNGNGRLHKVVGVVWDLAPPPDGLSNGGPFEIWVFCEPVEDQAIEGTSKVIPFPTSTGATLD